jgi:hypothetical protein
VRLQGSWQKWMMHCTAPIFTVFSEGLDETIAGNA